MVAALTTENKILLGGMGAIFIAFALASAFLIPRQKPDFPGRHVGLFALVCIAMFVAMMSAVEFFAVEEEEAHGGTATEVSSGTTETRGGETTAAQGDPAAGKQIFSAQGCGSCHTLDDAGTKGTIGPNLDDAKPDRALVIERVTNGKPPMPSFKDKLSQEEIADVAAYVVEATSR